MVCPGSKNIAPKPIKNYEKFQLSSNEFIWIFIYLDMINFNAQYGNLKVKKKHTFFSTYFNLTQTQAQQQHQKNGVSRPTKLSLCT